MSSDHEVFWSEHYRSVGDDYLFGTAPNRFLSAQAGRFGAGMQAAVRTCGFLFLQCYTPKQLEYRTGGPSAVENLYTRPMLEAAFGGWDIEILHEHEERIAEGQGRAGQSALIDLVARKPAD